MSGKMLEMTARSVGSVAGAVGAFYTNAELTSGNFDRAFIFLGVLLVGMIYAVAGPEMANGARRIRMAVTALRDND